jgi:hypothetical protein
MANPSDKEYGNYELIRAQLLVLPAPGTATKTMELKPEVTGGYERLKKRLCTGYFPYSKTQPITRQSPKKSALPANAVSSIGVMDIGTGGCNMVFAGAANEPVTYFDVGLPLNRFNATRPANMIPGAPAPSGPIMQNAAGNLTVILSHWDWDHWRGGLVWGLHGLHWLVPNQVLGPATQAALFRIVLNAAGVLHQFPAVPFIDFNFYTILRCNAAPGMPASVVMNNTGLAMLVVMQLPVTVPPTHHTVVLTGDANFNSVVVGAGAYLHVSAIGAAHHGSMNNGAIAWIPQPALPGNTNGRIFYSYGVWQNPPGVYHYGYNHPAPASLAAYVAAGWTALESRSTAQGPNIRMPTQATRGNIRVGNAGALPAMYGYSAFSIFPPGNVLS